MTNLPPTIAITWPVEFQDEVVHILSELGLSGYIRLVIDYPRPLDAERLACAVRRLLDAEPVLGCRFAVENGHPLWQRRDDLDVIADCPIITSDDIETATEQLLVERFDPWTSPNLRVTLLRSTTSPGERLLLRISHVIADGRAALDVAMTLTSLYSRLASDPEYQPPPNTASRDSFLWLRNFKFKDRFFLLLQDLKSLPATLGRRRGLTSSPEAFLADLQALQPGYQTLRLDEQLVTFLDRYAHEQGATLNDVCLAALFRALDTFCPFPADARLEVVMPTDLRRYAPLQRRSAIRNLAGTTYVRIGSKIGATFADTLNQVHQETLRHKRRLLGTEGQIMTLWLARASYTRKKSLIRRQILRDLNKPAPPVLTHFGHVKGHQLACDGVAPQGLAAFGEASPLPVFLITLARLDNTLCCTVCHDRCLDTRRVRAFLNNLRDNLTSLNANKAVFTPLP